MTLFKINRPIEEKVCFSLTNWSGWQLYIQKHSQAVPSSIPVVSPVSPEPDVTISYTEENGSHRRFVTIRSGGASIIMKASRYSYETKLLADRLIGYDQRDRRVVEFHEDDNSIYVALSGMNHPFEAERFFFNCSPESITFQHNNQTVMELKPAFIVSNPGAMQIKGWIYESFQEYLPYLTGLLGFVYLT